MKISDYGLSFEVFRSKGGKFLVKDPKQIPAWMERNGKTRISVRVVYNAKISLVLSIYLVSGVYYFRVRVWESYREIGPLMVALLKKLPGAYDHGEFLMGAL